MICGNIAVQRHTLQVRACGRRIDLPPKELELLMVLLEHTDWVFTREMLLDRVWGYDYAGTDRTVDNHIKKLRKSLGEAGAQIKTVFGVGYKLTGKEEEIP